MVDLKIIVYNAARDNQLQILKVSDFKLKREKNMIVYYYFEYKLLFIIILNEKSNLHHQKEQKLSFNKRISTK